MLIKRLKLKLGTKILFMVFVVILLFSASVGTVMLKEITENMKQMATEKAKGDLALSNAYIDDVISGDWQVKNNKLYKGKHKSMEMKISLICLAKKRVIPLPFSKAIPVLQPMS